jgi:hypothetical protein
VVVVTLALVWATPARAARDGYITTIDLLTIGPGDHIWSSMGHSALMVWSYKPGTKDYRARIYNWGDADFEAPGFIWRFFRGTAKFRLLVVESLPGFVGAYAIRNRTVEHHRFNLSQAQLARVLEALKVAERPENREYPYHHMEAGCATKIRDLLDASLGGLISQKTRGRPHPHTARTYGRRGLAGHLWAEIFNDLFMGRIHDQPMDRWYAMFHPFELRDALMKIRVPDPKGGRRPVPLLVPEGILTERQGPPPQRGQGRTLIHLSYLWITLLLVLGIFAWRAAPERPGKAGWWLALWVLPLGLASLLMAFGAAVSTVVEGRVNELMLVYPLTDLALLGVAWRWLRGRGTAGRLLRGYAWVRLGLVLLSAAGHATGLLYQQPRVLVVLAGVCALGLVLLTRRMDPAPRS